ncbi:Ankyrin repeat protein [Yarrowia sp. B02]|nr:Ankyrin repeat protein [Yarrowia sp. B02]
MQFPEIKSGISQESTTMKFGKYLAKRQLEVPEYGNYFINYKALKKLIKSLSNQAAAGGNVEQALRDNKATFFFRLERELEKVNSFYLQKEAELKLRIDILMEKKADAYASGSLTSSTSVSYISLYEGFQRFRRDLSKLEQFIELNATGFSKVLKKWDKRSKQQTKELYLSRAVEVQPVFHRDILARLSDQASSSILELEAWADGDVIFDDSRRGSEIQPATVPAPVTAPVAPVTAPGAKDDDLYYEFVETASAENVTTADISEWVEVLKKVRDAKSRVTRIFLLSISTQASNAALLALYESGLVDLNASDALNGRNVLHEAAMATAVDRTAILELAVSQGVSLLARDFYGRTPLHYACLHNQRKLLKMFVDEGAEVNALDKDNFTPLLYSVINQYSDCVRDLISMGASVDAVSDNGYIPLNLACQYGVYDASEIILQNKPRHEPDAEGLFALHIAARAGHSSLVSLLLKYDADVNELDKLNRWTALFHSANEGHEHVLETLLSAGARTDILDEERHSALYYAAWEGHVKCMHRLADLEATVKLQEVDIDMKSPVDVQPNDLGGLDELDGIPDLSLPPPILPFRRYGHNFLDQKIFVLITLAGTTPVKFVSEEATLSSGQLRISSKSDHSVIPRSVPLAMSDTDRAMSFQLDSLDDFALDFEIFPTFGTRIIAKTAALPYIWRATLTQFHQSYTLPLFDMRLHTIGEMSFDVQVVRPYKGTPLEITKYDTYWKSTGTSQQSLSFVTASSVSGQYARLTVCVTSDGVPVVTPSWKVDVGHGIRIGVNTLTFDELKKCTNGVHSDLSTVSDPVEVHRVLSNATLPLSEVLKLLPTTVKLDLNVIFAASDLNHYVDTILDVLFAHARDTHDTNRLSNGDPAPRATRSIILSSVNPDVCTALNWKQPNYPVFFVMRNGTFNEPTDLDRVSVSVKEAVLFANGNNMLGLVCDARLLNLVPALVESICSSGLVLVSDGEHECKGVKAMRNESVVEFHNSIDV